MLKNARSYFQRSARPAETTDNRTPSRTGGNAAGSLAQTPLQGYPGMQNQIHPRAWRTRVFFVLNNRLRGQDANKSAFKYWAATTGEPLRSRR